MDARTKRVCRNFAHQLATLHGVAHLHHGHSGGTDMLARWGGEEFLLLLYDTQPGAARPVLERVRQAVQERTVDVQGQPVRITVSIGVAAHTSSQSVAQLLDQADQALYRAKSDGRNRVVEAEAPQAAAPSDTTLV